MTYHEVVENQRKYFNTGETKRLEVRKELLRTLKKCALENADEFAEAVFKDLRRLQPVTKQIEIVGGMKEVDYILEHLDEWAAPTMVDRTDLLTEKDVPMIVKDPKGVLLIIGPWNYPVTLMFLPMAAALAAGNTVVLKPSEVSANTAEAFAKIIPKYFDKKVVAVVQGAVAETTLLLKERFDHIMYTGAPSVGRVIMAAAAKHLTPVTLELGGKCPVVVADDADVELTAKTLAKKFLNCGQTCTAPDYVLVSSGMKSKLVQELQKVIGESFSGDVKKSPNYSRMINERHFDRVKSLLDKSIAQVLIKAGELDRNDVFIPPVLLDVKADDAVMEDEIFGPVLPILTSESLDKSIDHINKGEKPLAAYIFTSDQKKAEKLYKETSSGAVVANDVMSHFSGEWIIGNLLSNLFSEHASFRRSWKQRNGALWRKVWIRHLYSREGRTPPKFVEVDAGLLWL
uniref:Aldehyde dehydrogenase n=1 Tax=Steinernema glaseri TaxID=37863 RepID=A0A1I7YJA6_9BILA